MFIGIPCYILINSKGDKTFLIDCLARQQGHAETYVKHHDDTDVCSLICKVTIAAALIGVVVVMVGLAMGCLLYRRRRQRHAGTLKHVGSLVSMNAVPSDYIVDDSLESRGHANRQASSPASNQGPWKNGISRQMVTTLILCVGLRIQSHCSISMVTALFFVGLRIQS